MNESATPFESLDPAQSDDPDATDAPPCVGCGWCCLSDPCNVSHELYGYQQRCPALVWSGPMNRYLCGLMIEGDEREERSRALFRGEGCCARHNPWRDDVRERG